MGSSITKTAIRTNEDKLRSIEEERTKQKRMIKEFIEKCIIVDKNSYIMWDTLRGMWISYINTTEESFGQILISDLQKGLVEELSIHVGYGIRLYGGENTNIIIEGINIRFPSEWSRTSILLSTYHF